MYYKPFVGWIWGGCLLMALGGLLAVLDRRYRATGAASAAAAARRRAGDDGRAGAGADSRGTP